ncbi:uncharacterized protein LDX57_007676 [Aspergillus melleus]|uniref:uncharacterized protein n=1 Tax=Aspergillus melleus TaxID=138277 RepID=UPI001E8EA47F|nr:uncharacterized protein LDX57_007676 [Aspergillus melleus]KAH8430003.1 hypothetical protein LDX57_007676 [Aspergillus melleus]
MSKLGVILTSSFPTLRTFAPSIAEIPIPPVIAIGLDLQTSDSNPSPCLLDLEMSTITALSSPPRASRGSEREESYASPKCLHLVGSGPSSSDGRKRRNHGSSSDEEHVVKWDGFSDEDLRVGGPYLCAIPVKTIAVPTDHPFYSRVVENVAPLNQGVRDILATADIRFHDMGFCGRTSVYDPEPTPALTLYIDANRSSIDDKWITTARIIHSFLVSNGVFGVSVELADPRAFDPIILHPVRNTLPIFSWERVAWAIIQQSIIHQWTTLGCYEITAPGEEKQVTVLVTVDPSVNKDWRGVREHLVWILDSFELSSVAVRIVKDRVLRGGGFSGPRLPLTALTAPAQVGQSIGVQGTEYAIGTFGGWVEMKDGNGRWEQFGLTCAKCVLPPGDLLSAEQQLGKGSNFPESTNGSLLMNVAVARWRIKGITPGDKVAESLLKVQQPSVLDLNRAIRKWDAQVEALTTRYLYQKVKNYLKNDEFVSPRDVRNFQIDQQALDYAEQAKDRIQSFRTLQSNNLGHVFACSGLNSIVPTTMAPGAISLSNMDWALIKPLPMRRGLNEVATFERPAVGDLPFPFQVGSILADGSGVKMSGGDRVFKCGRATGYTAGYYSELAEFHILTEMANGVERPIVTREYAITNSSAFSEPGDSGALIFNRDLQVVGMIFAISERNMRTYFTHIDDLFRDIKRVTGAQVVKIMD